MFLRTKREKWKINNTSIFILYSLSVLSACTNIIMSNVIGITGLTRNKYMLNGLSDLRRGGN